MEASSGVKCPVWFVALSVVVIVGCDFFVSSAIAMGFQTWDPCALIGSIIVFPIPTALAVQQYRGIFRRNARAARSAGMLLLGVGGFVVLAFFTTLGEMLLERMPTRRDWQLFLTPFVGIVFCLLGWLNLRWSRRLELVPPATASAPGRARFTVRELLAAVSIVACTTALVAHFVRSTLPRYAEDVAPEQAPASLPANARHVSYCQGLRGTIAYEFTTDEDSFVAWVESDVAGPEAQALGVVVRPIEGAFSIRRYYSLTTAFQGLESIAITNGLYYRWREEDRGVSAAFDRSTGRAYYFRHLH